MNDPVTVLQAIAWTTGVDMLDVAVVVGMLMGFVIGVVLALLAAHRDAKRRERQNRAYLPLVEPPRFATDLRITQLEVDLRKIKRRIALVGHTLLNHIDGRTHD